MQAGKLRHRVTIQRLVTGSPTQNAGGEPDASWADVATVYASIEPLRGRELLVAQQINSEVTGTIRVRYRAGLTSADRIKFGTRYYDVLGITNPEERNRELLLQVREGPNNG